MRKMRVRDDIDRGTEKDECWTDKGERSVRWKNEIFALVLYKHRYSYRLANLFVRCNGTHYVLISDSVPSQYISRSNSYKHVL